MRKIISSLAFMSFFCAFALNVSASSFEPEKKSKEILKESQVPNVLKDWKDWVLLDNKKDNCDYSYNSFDEKFCYYISSLNIEVNKDEMNFVQDVNLLEDGYILLVGSVDVFPSVVSANEVSQNIISKAGRPYIFLKKGNYKITGFAKSKKNITHLFIPENSSILNVKKDGVLLSNPLVDGSVVRFEAQNVTKSASDDISIFAYRRIFDFVPMSMTLNLKLNVTGKERVEHLGNILAKNFKLLSVDSNVSAYIQKNGELVAELKPGNAEITLVYRQINESLEISLDKSLVTSEIWVLENDESVRVIGAGDDMVAVQTQNTSIPNDWRSLPAYSVNVFDVVKLKTIYFNENNDDNLVLNRTAKLSFDGKFFSIKDNISGDIKTSGRFSVSPVFELYSSEVNGAPVSVTYEKDSKKEGVEIRKGNANISNVLRTKNEDRSIPATGYDRKFSSTTLELELAPGYQLLHVTGADDVSNSWLKSWDLVSLFIVFLVSVCFYYTFGIKKAIGAFVLFVFLHPILPILTYISFILCGLTALQRVVTCESKFYNFIIFARYSMLFFVIFSMFIFIVKHFRSAVYPALDTYIDLDLISSSFLMSFYILVAWLYIIYLIVKSGMKTFKKVFSIIALLFSGFIVKAVILFLAYGPIGSFAPRIYESDNIMYDKQAYSYDEMVSEAPMAVSGMGRSSKRDMIMQVSNSQKILSKKLDVNKYQSLNVAKNIAQTGVGFPDWRGRNNSTIYLNGPVLESDSFGIYLISPCMGIFLALLRGLLILFLLYSLIDYKKTKYDIGEKGKKIMKKVLMGVLVGFIFMAPKISLAGEIPSNELLSELSNKMDKTYIPSCLPDCVSIPNGKIVNDNDFITIKFSVHSNEKLVLPIPFIASRGTGYVKLEEILIDGKKAVDTLKVNKVYILIPKGISELSLKYKLDESSDEFALASKVMINYIDNKMSDFSFSELPGSGEQIFHINRLKKVADSAKKTSELAKIDIDSFFSVKRSFDFGITWDVNTSVERANNFSESATVEVPIIAGESVLSSDVVVQDGKIIISFAPYEKVKYISSIVPVEQKLKLKTGSIDKYNEEWEFNVGNIWSFNYQGIKPVVSSKNLMLFKPRAGEELVFDVFKPENVDGYVVTFDRVSYNIKQGRGIMELSLNLDLRASEAGNHDVILPDDIIVKNLMISGSNYPITVNGNILTIPVVSGRNNVNITAELKEEIGFATHFPYFDLQAPVTNINQVIDVPKSRWVLFAKGPIKGPVVLFWSMIPAWLLFAFVFSRFKMLPLGFTSWFVLLLGLTQINLFSMFIIIAWFFAFGLRNVLSEEMKFRKLFQVVLVFLSVLFVVQIMNSVYTSLLSSTASMRIVGEGSSTYYGVMTLAWYQDLLYGNLPTPCVYSIPIWVYRTLMVLWSAWLCVSFVKWVKWGYKSFIKDYVWK